MKYPIVCEWHKKDSVLLKIPSYLVSESCKCLNANPTVINRSLQVRVR